jgi:MoxR-like ATPase
LPAALVTEDPMLLIGQSDTGNIYLLNTISEAVGFEHRHYPQRQPDLVRI